MDNRSLTSFSSANYIQVVCHFIAVVPATGLFPQKYYHHLNLSCRIAPFEVVPDK